MGKRFDVVALGEALIDFTEAGRTPDGARLFAQNPGGAPANAACAVARLGGKAAFLGKVGRDMHGMLLRDTLSSLGVDVSGLVMDDTVFTTLAFVALTEAGERSFSFARKPGADTCLQESDISLPLLESSRVLHLGSLSMTDEPARSATLFAMEQAKKVGCIISYDPNYRASLWPDQTTAQEQMRRLIPYTDVLKLSGEETELLTGIAEPEAAAQALLAQGPACVAVTLDRVGALVATAEGMRHVPGFQTQAVDTTGAGDAFWGAFLSRLTQSGKTPATLTLDEAAAFTRFANAAASLCVGRFGGIPAMPTLAEVEDLLAR